jgi:hypothetical protein
MRSYLIHWYILTGKNTSLDTLEGWNNSVSRDLAQKPFLMIHLIAQMGTRGKYRFENGAVGGCRGVNFRFRIPDLIEIHCIILSANGDRNTIIRNSLHTRFRCSSETNRWCPTENMHQVSCGSGSIGRDGEGHYSATEACWDFETGLQRPVGARYFQYLSYLKLSSQEPSTGGLAPTTEPDRHYFID